MRERVRRHIILRMVLLGVFAIAISGTVHGAWWNDSFPYCQNIEITPPETGTLTDFPLFITLEAQSQMRSDYADLRFINTKCNDGGSELTHYIEYSNTTHAQTWVQATINSSTNISVYFGNPSATTIENEQGVWDSNFAIAYSMESGGPDSTVNNRNRVADVGTPAQQTGPVGYEMSFNGANAWSQANMAYWEAAFTERTHEIVFRTGSDITTRQALFAEGGATNGLVMYIVGSSLYARWWSESDGWTGAHLSATISANSEYHAVMDFSNSSDYRLFLNGSRVGFGTPPSGIASHTGDGGIAYTNTNKDFHDVANTGPAYFTGEILAFHAHNTQRTSAWYNLSYEMFLQPSDAVTISSPVSQSPTIVSVTVNQSSFLQGDDARITAIVEDVLGPSFVSSVIATIQFPDNTTADVNLSQTTLFGQQRTGDDLELATTSIAATDGATIIGESGEVSLSNANVTIAFQNNYATMPVVLAVPTTENSGTDGGETFVIEILNTTHMIVNMCKDDGATGCVSSATNETFHYTVFDTAYATNYSWMEIGTISGTTDGSDTAVTFTNTFANTPYVFATVQTNNDGLGVGAPSIWTDAPTTGSVNLIGCVHSGSGDACTTGALETFGYVAIDPVLANITGLQTGSAIISDSTFTSATFSPAYTTPRVMVMQNDDNGGQDPQYHEARLVTTTGMEYRYCEQDALGVCNTHTGENTAWFALEAGSISVPGTFDTEATREGPEYQNAVLGSITNITQLSIQIVVGEYESAGSDTNTNTLPDIEVLLLNSTDTYQSIGLLGANQTGIYQVQTSDSAILSHWNFEVNRDMQLHATSLDYVNATSFDNITITSVTATITYDNTTSEWTYTQTNLTLAGQYNITQINATNSGGVSNSTVYTNKSYNVTADTPQILAILNASITDTSAIITWNTNEEANSSVAYGTTTALGLRESQGGWRLAHSILLSSLLSNTTYYYNITSCDEFNNCNNTEQYNFTTLTEPDVSAPIITNISVTNITEHTAIVRWSTNEFANASVRYGNTTAVTNSSARSTFFETHAIALTNLEPLVTYYYNITSCDASGNCNITTQYSFLTPDLTAPAWSAYATSPPNASTYVQGQEYAFNLTWTDQFNIDTVQAEHNFSGFFQNTTLSSTGGVYTLNISDVSAGTYVWRMRANDTSSNTNTSPYFTYVVSPVTSVITLTLNGTAGDVTISTDSAIPVVANLTIPTTGVITLEREEVVIASGNSPLQSNQTFVLEKFYNITATYAGNANHTPASVTYFVRAVKPRVFVPTVVQAENAITTLGTSTTSLDVPLDNAYDLSRTFVTIRYASEGTAGLAPDDSTATAHFINETHLRIQRYAAGQNLYASYSILEASNIAVTSWNHSWSSAQELATVDIQRLPDNYEEKCFIETHRNMRVNSSNTDSYGENEVRVQFFNASQLSLSRDTEGTNTADPGVQHGFVVCFLDGTVVETGGFSIAGDVGSEQSYSVGPVTSNESFAIIHHEQADSGVGQNSLIANISSSSQLTVHRDEIGSGQTALGQYHIIQFESGAHGFVQNIGYQAPGTGTALTYTTSEFTSVNQNKSYLQCQNTMGNGGGNAHTRANFAFEINDSSNGVFMREGRDRTDTQFSDVVCYVVTWPNQTTYREPAELVLRNLSASPAVPIEGQFTNITLDILNNGSQEAENFTIHLNISKWNGTSWVRNQTQNDTITRLNATLQTNQVFVWAAKAGLWQFSASVDGNDAVLETNEANNAYTINITVSSWHIFYGNVENNFRILSDGASNLSYWSATNNIGNVFGYDSDGTVEYLSLTGFNQTDDFVQADQALQLIGHPDSVEELFDKDKNGLADQTYVFTIAGQAVTASSINTTNSSSFKTGILWDSSVSTNYDGTQPLIFITEFNGTHQGLYGVYEYEIRVPSTLKELLEPVDSVAFTVELT